MKTLPVKYFGHKIRKFFLFCLMQLNIFFAYQQLVFLRKIYFHTLAIMFGTDVINWLQVRLKKQWSFMKTTVLLLFKLKYINKNLLVYFMLEKWLYFRIRLLSISQFCFNFYFIVLITVKLKLINSFLQITFLKNSYFVLLINFRIFFKYNHISIYY